MQKKSDVISIILLCLLLPAVVVGGYFFSFGNLYYIMAAIIIVASMIPFFISFEKGRSKTREIVSIASVTAVAVISRCAFYMLPQIKPIGAVVIVAAAAFGYEAGFLIGALSMLLSDMIFGIGLWTPFQMVGMGLVGMICALLFAGNSKLKSNRLLFSLAGGIITFAVYGLTVDTCSVFLTMTERSLKAVLSVYGAGMIYNLIFGATTAVLLFLFGKSLSEKLERLKIKYGIFRESLNNSVG